MVPPRLLASLPPTSATLGHGAAADDGGGEQQAMRPVRHGGSGISITSPQCTLARPLVHAKSSSSSFILPSAEGGADPCDAGPRAGHDECKGQAGARTTRDKDAQAAW
jgi:hypothetical protein